MLKRLVLSPPERQRLQERVRSRSARADEVLLPKIILLVASGESQWAVGRQLRMQHQHIGLYFKPPVNAAVFGVDEKSAIQAPDRLDPVCCSRPEEPSDTKPRRSSLWRKPRQASGPHSIGRNFPFCLASMF